MRWFQTVTSSGKKLKMSRKGLDFLFYTHTCDKINRGGSSENRCLVLKENQLKGNFSQRSTSKCFLKNNPLRLVHCFGAIWQPCAIYGNPARSWPSNDLDGLKIAVTRFLRLWRDMMGSKSRHGIASLSISLDVIESDAIWHSHLLEELKLLEELRYLWSLILPSIRPVPWWISDLKSVSGCWEHRHLTHVLCFRKK